ncbi:hypothetical protein [Bdellovibrio sp. ArHS]|uniref:hypothetical protein n=1 Tax=Bdellovibrio sp. ArHS TaxID=1569284 RepID=UPI000AE3CE17|nr:hypothetical protein [Bdellovibrio sp. ArHS]
MKSLFIVLLLLGSMSLYTPHAFAQSGGASAPAAGGGGGAGGGDYCADTDDDKANAAAPGTGLTNGASGTNPGKDEAGKGKIESCNKIKSLMEGISTNIQTYKQKGMVNDQFEKIREGFEQYAGWRQSCLSNHSRASTVCLEDWSPDLASTASNINILLSTLGGMAVNDSCSGFAKAMDLAKAGLTAYTSACGVMKAGCGVSCVKARSGLESMQKFAAAAAKSTQCAPLTGPDMTACAEAKEAYAKDLQRVVDYTKEEQDKADKKSISGKVSLCTGKYAQLLASAGTGIMSLANSMKQGQKCDEDTSGSSTPTTTASTEEKCKDSANANLPECICLANPRTPGCANSYEKPGESSTISGLSTGSTDKTNVTGDRSVAGLGGGGIPGLDSPTGGSSGGDSGLPGAPSGGSAGLGGGGGLNSSGGDKPSEASAKGLDTNILGGAGGGGGGGGFGSFGGGSGDKYRAYLPGGAKDPSKGLAGQQQAWKNEVTGQGGKSNWEKIKERYRDNKNTLLNN